MEYTFNRKFTIVGYKDNSYENKKGNTVEQYILNVLCEHENYVGYYVRQIYANKKVLGNLKLEDYFGMEVNAKCSYYKPLNRMYLEKVDTICIDDKEVPFTELGVE